MNHIILDTLSKEFPVWSMSTLWDQRTVFFFFFITAVKPMQTKNANILNW